MELMAETDGTPLKPQSKSVQNIVDNVKNGQPEEDEENQEAKIEPPDESNVNKENQPNGSVHCEEELNNLLSEEEENEKVSTTKSTGATSEIENEDDNAVDIEVKVEKTDEVENDPNFAVICSFLLVFGPALEINYSIEQLKIMFEDYSKGKHYLEISCF